jgi:hypothetical protein
MRRHSRTWHRGPGLGRRCDVALYAQVRDAIGRNNEITILIGDWCWQVVAAEIIKNLPIETR